MINKLKLLDFKIKIINSDDVLLLRSKILRNNIDPKECKFNGDNNIDTYHFGAFNSNNIIGAVTLINNKCEKMEIKNCYQMRGLCVDDSFQNKGIGKKLVKKVEKKLKQLKIDNIWMNARESAIQFYLNLNYTNTNIKYSIGQIGLHFLMYKKL